MHRTHPIVLESSSPFGRLRNGRAEWGEEGRTEAHFNITSYNRRVRIAPILLLILSLAACNRGTPSNDAMRQGVVEHLAKVGLNVGGMDVTVTSVQVNGNQADATVQITPKGGNPGAGMAMKYHLEQQGGKWVVTGRQDTGAPHGGRPAGGAPNPHGEGAMPGGTMPPANPHGGAGMGAPAGGGAMPSPEDLPPAKKK